MPCLLQRFAFGFLCEKLAWRISSKLSMFFYVSLNIKDLMEHVGTANMFMILLASW